MARVHDLLSKSESDQRVDLATYVTDLCEALRPITEDEGRVGFHVSAEDGILVEADTAFALGIILTELVTNAVKYAFPPPRSGTIFAHARRGDPDRLEVSIRDDGIGMASFREGSLGYGLVRSLVEQIRRHDRCSKRPGFGCNSLVSSSVGQLSTGRCSRRRLHRLRNARSSASSSRSPFPERTSPLEHSIKQRERQAAPRGAPACWRE